MGAPKREKGCLPRSGGRKADALLSSRPFRCAENARSFLQVRLKLGTGPRPLRRGAWYPVLSAGPEEAVVVIRNRAVVPPAELPRDRQLPSKPVEDRPRSGVRGAATSLTEPSATAP